jgi:hypothetical protein
LGFAHPLISGVENVIAWPMAFLAILHPEIALLVMIVVGVPLLWLLWTLASRAIRAVKAAAKASSARLSA